MISNCESYYVINPKVKILKNINCKGLTEDSFCECRLGISSGEDKRRTRKWKYRVVNNPFWTICIASFHWHIDWNFNASMKTVAVGVAISRVSASSWLRSDHLTFLSTTTLSYKKLLKNKNPFRIGIQL